MAILSIIVPVYNKANYIDSCIKSILEQSMINFELILVNDGSTDNSGEKCDYYKSLDNRVIVIHQENKGVSAARNAGLDIAQGQYIGFVDSDDTLEPDMYEILLNNALKYNSDISMCGVKRIFPDKIEKYGGNKEIKFYSRDEGVSELLRGNILLSNYDKIFKAETVKNIRFEPALFEDTFYNFEALKNASKTVYDDSLKYNYIIRDNSHSLSSFGTKYMNTILLTKKMLQICIKEMPQHIHDSKTFDFNSNIFVLNLILVASKDKHPQEYNQVVSNLNEYSTFFRNAKGIKPRYRYGYLLFKFSPVIYTSILNIYSKLTKSEHLQRKENKSNEQVKL